MKLFFLSVFVLISADNIFSQNEDIIIGQNATKIGAALFDLSDPTGVNIEVNVWGTVRYPGRYRVPLKTTFLDLLSYAGGPLDNTKLEDIRIYRPAKDSMTGKPEIMIINYEDMLREEKIKSGVKLNPTLRAGDVILFPEERRYTLRDNVGFFLPIISTIIGIITLVITLKK